VTRRATCTAHGDRREALVFKPVEEALHERARRGVFCAEREGEREAAWCAEREDRRVAAGGERRDERTDEMDIALLRGSCFDTARRIDGVET
jgi:hypothetical protein